MVSSFRLKKKEKKRKGKKCRGLPFLEQYVKKIILVTAKLPSRPSPRKAGPSLTSPAGWEFLFFSECSSYWGNRPGRKPTEASILQGVRGTSQELTLPQFVSCRRGPSCRGFADRQAQPRGHGTAAATITTQLVLGGRSHWQALLSALPIFTRILPWVPLLLSFSGKTAEAQRS